MIEVFSSGKYEGLSPTAGSGQLKASILDRISTAKKNRSDENGIPHSQRSSVTMFRPPLAMFRPSVEQQQSEKLRCERWEQIVLKNQSPKNEGFYEYINWQKLHDAELGFLSSETILEFWKILRIINYGQICIPTGLVYELLKEAKDQAKRPQSGNFQRIIESFLLSNQVPDNLRAFKELKGYTCLATIEARYKQIEEKEKDGNNQKHGCLRKQRGSLHGNSHQSLLRKDGADSVYQRNFKEAERRSAKKVRNIVGSLVEGQKGASFQPKTNCNALSHISKIHQDDQHPTIRICQEREKHVTKTEDEKYVLKDSDKIEAILRAKRLDRSIFQGSIDAIPGVGDHLNRHQYCQAQKLRNNRRKQRPSYASTAAQLQARNSYASLYQYQSANKGSLAGE